MGDSAFSIGAVVAAKGRVASVERLVVSEAVAETGTMLVLLGLGVERTRSSKWS